jgi:tetratricopeptide (TPR) repeat protein
MPADRTSAAALPLLDALAAAHPRADTPRRLALHFAPLDAFAPLARAHLRKGLRKGVPSLFTSTKALYSDAAKRDAIEALILEFAAAAEAGTLRFSDDADADAADVDADADARRDADAPTAYLWTLYYLAQHESFLGRHASALTRVDAALVHTPTLPELHTLRARILKRLGDPPGAAHALEAARALDGQDRFLNTKAAKYRQRAGMPDDAQDVLGLFTKVREPRPLA